VGATAGDRRVARAARRDTIPYPSRDVERVLPFPDPGRFGTSGLDCLPAVSWTLARLAAAAVS
jgi:hypothetical protein